MAYYMISYDLQKEKDYDRVFEGIKKISKDVWCKPLLSAFIIYSEHDWRYVRDFMLAYIDSNDKLFVIKVDKSQWGSWNIPKDVEDWLNN